MNTFLLPNDFSLRNTEHIYKLQQMLTALSITIDNAERNSRSYGLSTQQAVITFQAIHGLAENAEAISAGTIAALNSACSNIYRVCGAVTNKFNIPIADLKVEIYTSIISFGIIGGEVPRIAINISNVQTLSDGTFCAFLTLQENSSKDDSVIRNDKLVRPKDVDIYFGQDNGKNIIYESFNGYKINNYENIYNFTLETLKPTSTNKYDDYINILSTTAFISIRDLLGMTPENINKLSSFTSIPTSSLMNIIIANMAINSTLINPFFSYMEQNYPHIISENILSDFDSSTGDLDNIRWTEYKNDLYAKMFVGLSMIPVMDLESILQEAYGKNLIPASSTSTSSIASLITDDAIYSYYKYPLLEGSVSLETIITTAVGSALTVAKKKEVAQLFISNMDNFDNFISKLEEGKDVTGISAANIRKLSLSFQICRIIRNHPTVLSTLLAKYTINFIIANTIHPEFIATIPLVDWEDMIKVLFEDSGVEATYDFGIYDDYIKFSQLIFNNAQTQYPDKGVITVFESKGVTDIKEIKTLLDENPDFNMLTDRIETILKKPDETSSEEEKAIFNQFKKIQGAFRSSPNPEAAAVLFEHNLTRADQIYIYGKNKLHNALKDSLTKEEIDQIYNIAAGKYAYMLSALTNINYALNTPNLTVLPEFGVTKEQKRDATEIPDLEEMFGDTDYYDWDVQRSVYGAPAYLADILTFFTTNLLIKNENDKITVKEYLDLRRPDIANIYLNIENSETLMPYIDIVCEILEEECIKTQFSTYSRDVAQCQSTRTSEELLAVPEHILSTAGGRTAYDIMAEALYPMNSNINLWQEEIREYLNRMGIIRYELMDDVKITLDATLKRTMGAEFFKLYYHEATIVIGGGTITERNQAWSVTISTGTTQMSIDQFAQDTNLSYKQIFDLVNNQENIGNGTEKVSWIGLTFAGYFPNVPNSAKNIRISGVLNAYDRANRFIRLWKKSGWKIWELNLLLQSNKLTNYVSSSTNNLNENALYNLMQFKQQQDILNIGVEELLVFYDNNINTINIKENTVLKYGLFDRLFKQEAFETPMNAAIETIKNGETSQFSDEDFQFIAACMDTSLNNIELLKDKYPISSNNKYGMPFLAYLYSNILFAKKLNISIEDLLLVYNIIGHNPGTAEFSVSSMTDFIVKVNEVLYDSKFSLNEYNYLTNYEYQYSSTDKYSHPVSLKYAEMKLCLDNIKASLQESIDETSISKDIYEIKIANILSELFDMSVEMLLYYISKSTIIPIFSINTATTIASEFNKELNKKDISPTYDIKLYKTLILIHKVSLIVKRNNLTLKEFKLLVNLLEYSNEGFNQSELSYSWYENINSFDRVFNLSKMISLEHKYGEVGDEKSLFTIITDNQNGNYINDLCDLTKWNFDDTVTLINRFGYTIDNYDFQKHATYDKIEKILSYKDKLGVDLNKIFSWGNITANEKVKRNQVYNTLKTKYSIPDWLEMMKEVQKPIREAKADALSAYLIAYSIRQSNPKFTDDESLYNYFFIDPKMRACMKISRIVQATNSAQLLAQRLLLNLEDYVIEESENNTNSDWERWEWMKKYRTWEANRKVLLYPENWIEPELRDDKSPFFKEFEDELSQSEITDEHVTTVFENYLYKLRDVANLVVCGMYKEKTGDGKIYRLHVIAQTRQQPYEYYYRYFDISSWSPWEKIDLQIGDKVITPYVYNKKLYLFWLQTEQKTIESEGRRKDNNGNDVPNDPIKYTQVQLCWSSYKNNKWSAVEYSLRKNIINGHFQKSDISFTIYNENNELVFTILLLGTKKMQFDNNRPYSSCILRGFFVYNGYDVTAYSVLNDTWKYQYIDKGDIHLFYSGAKGWYVENDTNIRNLVDSMSLDTAPYSIVLENSSSAGSLVHYIDYMRFSENKHVPYNSINDKEKTTYLPYNNAGANYIVFLKSEIREPVLLLNINDKDNIWNSYFTVPAFDPYLFYQDSERGFFSKYSFISNKNTFKLFPFYHTYTDTMICEIKKYGISGLLNINFQNEPQKPSPDMYHSFSKYTLNPNNNEKFNIKFDKEDNVEIDFIDFSTSGSYSLYNWELFFHAPFYIACKLSQDNKFEEAMKWFNYIFDPTSKSTEDKPKKYWNTKPFYDMSSDDYSYQNILNILKPSNYEDYKDMITNWMQNPYNPFAIARTRTIAFQRAVIMKYLDNLIAWADQLFRQNSMESINEATLLYILAYEILGKKPQALPLTKPDNNFNKNFNNLFSAQPYWLWTEIIENNTQYDYSPINNNNNLISQEYGGSQSTPSERISRAAAENPNTSTNQNIQQPVQGHETNIPIPPDYVDLKIPFIDADNFKLLPNDNLLGYWDKIEDRLFKLRNCMNIDGIVQELSLFEAPIDPALLVKAAAAGMSIGDALAEITAPQPYYRFRVLIQKAIQYTNEVKQFGDKLLSVLEKKDAEYLNNLRNTHEINIQQASISVRKYQIEEAKQTIASIQDSIKSVEFRRDNYNLREFMSDNELSAYVDNEKAVNLRDKAAIAYIALSLTALIPEFALGIAGISSPLSSANLGGLHMFSSGQALIDNISHIAGIYERNASLLSTMSGYERRKEDWDFQADLAEKEIPQLEKQLAAAEIRLSVAEKELENLELQIEQSKTVKEYYESKYTNEQLYDWMIAQTSNVYYEAYKTAYDMAKRAEKCYQFELGVYDGSDFIKFDNWNSLKKGLLSGEKLMYDLNKLDSAYTNENKRKLEITKNISLADVFPQNLVQLITGKATTIDIPEILFDMDYPGHYNRRIKSVSVTIPNIAGPYQNVNCMLSLNSAKIRKTTDISNGYADTGSGDNRFISQTGTTNSICTSSAQNDSGMFELNFNDERFLPFENAGVISQWTLSFPASVDQLDLSTISDVILHINYTADSDMGNFKNAAAAYTKSALPDTSGILVNLKSAFSKEWAAMSGNQGNTLSFNMESKHIPFYMRGKSGVKIKSVTAFFTTKNDQITGNVIMNFNTNNQMTFTKNNEKYGDLNVFSSVAISPNSNIIGAYTISFQNIDPELIEDIVLGIVLE